MDKNQNPEEGTVEYWKKRAEGYKKNFEASQEELEEFQLQSRELEKELELQLEQLERKNADLLHNSERLKRERDFYKEKFEQTSADNRKHIGNLEQELSEAIKTREELRSSLRELEQSNDDLERGKRNITAILDDIDKKLNETLERNAILESELVDKDQLLNDIQHLREESRDLRQEVLIREQKEREQMIRHASVKLQTPPPKKFPSTPSRYESNSMEVVEESLTTTPAGVADFGKMRLLPRSCTIDGTEIGMTPNSVTSPRPLSTPVAGSTRISALNIVGDLLRKVGSLEMKLQSSRKAPSTNKNGGPQAKHPHLETPKSTQKKEEKSKKNGFSKLPTPKSKSGSPYQKLK